MSKKLMFLVSIFVLLGLVKPASAVVVDGYREWNEQTQLADIGGLEITATGHAKFTARVDQDAVDVTIAAGGILESQDMYKLPDDHPEPTTTNVYVNGTWNANNIESKGTSRAAYIYVGATGVINIQIGYGGTAPYENPADYDPQTWLADNSLLLDPALNPAVWSIEITDLGGGAAKVTTKRFAVAIGFDSPASGALESVSPALLTVSLPESQTETFTVDYSVTGGSATRNVDYTLADGTLTFSPGQTTRTISISIVNDGLDEDDETIIVTLSNPTGPDAILGEISQHTYTIIDMRPKVSFEAESTSGLEDATPAQIAVTLSHAGGQAITVDYAVTGGTATRNTDYTLADGMLVFDPGQTTKTISIDIIENEPEEDNETIIITLSNPTGNSRLGDNVQHTFTITERMPLCPIADAGSSRYAGADPVQLDGTGSYDPDDSGVLGYQWQKISGPAVVITDSDTAMPTISGFVQTSKIQRCEFELIVNDGRDDSLPDTVEVVIVPMFPGPEVASSELPFDVSKPTLLAFSNPDFITWRWRELVNNVTIIRYGPETYRDIANKFIVFLSKEAPNYNQTIQVTGGSAGGGLVTHMATYLNNTYKDPRYAVNRLTLLDQVGASSSDALNFFDSRVCNEQCWIDNYISEMGIWLPKTLNIRFPVPPADHGTPDTWYWNYSFEPSTWSTNMYNNGLTGGAYLSVVDPAKNLQLATDSSPYYFQWEGSVPNGPGTLEFYNESSYPGRLPEPVTLVGPNDGDFVDANGVVLSCEVSQNVVGYQLLFGHDPQHMDYIISDTPAPPTEILTAFPFKETWWTIKVRDQYGSTIYADPRRIIPDNVVYNYVYLEYFVEHWLDTGLDMPGDLNTDYIINFLDFATFALDWHGVEF